MRVSINGGTPSSHPFRTMGFSLITVNHSASLGIFPMTSWNPPTKTAGQIMERNKVNFLPCLITGNCFMVYMNFRGWLNFNSNLRFNKIFGS